MIMSIKVLKATKRTKACLRSSVAHIAKNACAGSMLLNGGRVESSRPTVTVDRLSPYREIIFPQKG